MPEQLIRYPAEEIICIHRPIEIKEAKSQCIFLQIDMTAGSPDSDIKWWDPKCDKKLHTKEISCSFNRKWKLWRSLLPEDVQSQSISGIENTLVKLPFAG
jgi:hypothetical protein